MRTTSLALLFFIGACGRTDADRPGERSRLVVYNAGSLARPIRAALQEYARRESVVVEQESAGSLETARKITELGKVPDVIALADPEVFPALLIPAHVRWYAAFARNRMVIAYRDRSAGAGEITGDNWWRVLARPGIAVGRSDPDLDPNGYRTLLVLRLAERRLGQPNLERDLIRQWGTRYVRPKEVDLLALLEAGEVDYIWSYESLARTAGVRYVRLGDSLDLGAPGDSARYAEVSVRVAGAARRDTITIAGAPIVYALSIPTAAANQAAAADFARFLLSDDGRAAMRREGLDVLDEPIVTGTGVPARLRGGARQEAPVP